MLRRPDVAKLMVENKPRGLIRALTYRDDPEVRAEAAVALAELCEADAIEPLAEAAQHDPDPDVRATAAESLQRILDEIEASGARLKTMPPFKGNLKSIKQNLIWRVKTGRRP